MGCTVYQLIAVAMAKKINSDDASYNKNNKKKTIHIVKIINYVSIQLTYVQFIKIYLAHLTNF